MNDKLTTTEVLHVAKLAKIRIKENELEKYSNKITNKYKEIESTTLIDLK